MATAKGKGAKFERATCQRLSLWVSCRTREDCFWRSAMSGGRATLKSRRVSKGKRKAAFGAQSGDITATHALGNLLTELFVVECKHYRTIDADTPVFTGKGGRLIHKFWSKVVQEAADTQREPLLVACQNNREIILCTTKRGLDMLRWGERANRPLRINAIFPQHGMRVLRFKDVLMTDFAKFRKMAKLKRARQELE